MSLRDDVRRGLPELQALAESLMTLTLTLYEPTGKTTNGDGNQVQAYTSRGQTIGKVQAGSQAGSDTPTRYLTIGGVQRPVLEAGLHIPIGATVPAPGEQRGIGWEYVISSVGDLADTSLLGRRFLVVGVPAKSFATARRLDVCEVD